MAKHSEDAFVPMNLGDKVGGPWFAIGCTRWTAREARGAFLNGDSRDPKLAWKSYREGGWRIVKARITAQPV